MFTRSINIVGHWAVVCPLEHKVPIWKKLIFLCKWLLNAHKLVFRLKSVHTKPSYGMWKKYALKFCLKRTPNTLNVAGSNTVHQNWSAKSVNTLSIDVWMQAKCGMKVFILFCVCKDKLENNLNLWRRWAETHINAKRMDTFLGYIMGKVRPVFTTAVTQHRTRCLNENERNCFNYHKAMMQNFQVLLRKVRRYSRIKMKMDEENASADLSDGHGFGCPELPEFTNVKWKSFWFASPKPTT